MKKSIMHFISIHIKEKLERILCIFQLEYSFPLLNFIDDKN